MRAVFDFLIGQPILVLFLLVAIGSFVGRGRIKGISLGPAAVLFVAMGFTAWAVGTGISIDSKGFDSFIGMLEDVGNLGLALFTFAVGLVSGPTFFRQLRTGWGPILGTVVAVIAAAGTALGLGLVLNLPHSLVAGAFAGGLTNTPALAAAVDAAGNPAQDSPTIAYSITYLFGVIGILCLTILALRNRANDPDTPAPLTNLTARVDRDDRPSIRDIEHAYGDQITFSHVRRGEQSPTKVPQDDDLVLEKNDLVTIVGPPKVIEKVARDLGHSSSHNLFADRKFVDMRRITLSNPKLAGRTIAQLGLAEKFGAVVTRVRRGDLDMLAHDSLRLQPGDRLRVICPSGKIKPISRYLGDSARGLSDLNPIAFGLGMALGIYIGTITIPIGGGFTLGSAAGTLIVGIALGAVGRIGPIVTTLPNTAATVLSELGMVLFLAFAGARAGGQIVTYWDPNQIGKLFVLGIAITMVMGVIVYVAMRRLFKMGGTKLAGLLGGVQTQPAILAYGNERTGFDSRVALGYALVYPTSMVVKILLAQVLGGL